MALQHSASWGVPATGTAAIRNTANGAAILSVFEQ
jgi:hypothetical protein